MIGAEELRRRRLAAQRLAPGTEAADVAEAVRAAVGIQAQDLRAMRLALRSRVPGLERSAVDDEPGLVRTWTLRGTVHLHHADDLPWLHALLGPRNRRYFDGLLANRDSLALARELRGPFLEVLAEEGPRTRAEVLARLAERGHPELGQPAINVVTAWMTAHGLLLGRADGRLRPADPPEPVGEDEALGTLARRYLAGYGPASADDLAYWAGLGIGVARRALSAAGALERAGELFALPGALDAPPPPPPPAALLAAFDTLMLGWRSRGPFVPAGRDREVLPGGGILRPVTLARGRGAGTWRAERGRVVVEWFGRPAPARALAAETRDVERFLASPVSGRSARSPGGRAR